MTTTKKCANRGQSGGRYLELVRECPLRPIRTKRDYTAAIKTIDQLAVRDEDKLDRDEVDYLDVLTNLVEAYENQHYPAPERVPTRATESPHRGIRHDDRRPGTAVRK